MAYVLVAALALTLLAIFVAGVLCLFSRRHRLAGLVMMLASLLVAGLIVGAVLAISAQVNSDIR